MTLDREKTEHGKPRAKARKNLTSQEKDKRIIISIYNLVERSVAGNSELSQRIESLFEDFVNHIGGGYVHHLYEETSNSDEKLDKRFEKMFFKERKRGINVPM